jgi:hypothetical protein
LKFIDPKGEKIELLGDEEARRKAFELLRQAVGEQAGAYLYERKVENKDGSVQYYAEIRDKGPDGKGPTFESLNRAASVIGSIIRDDAVVGVSVVPRGVYQGPNGEKVPVAALGVIGASPGVTIASGNSARIWLLDPNQSYGYLPGGVMSNGQRDAIDPAIAFAHELGHVAFKWAKMMGPTNNAGVTLENWLERCVILVARYSAEALRLGFQSY